MSNQPYFTVDPSENGSGKTPAIIVIPIGLIITIICAIVKLLVPSQQSTYSQSEIDTLNRGYSHFVQEDYHSASREFSLLIRENPNFGEAYNGRGLVYHAMGNYDKAIADFDRSIELLPNRSVGYNNRGIAYFAKGEFDQAIADFDKAIQLNSGLAKAYYNRALVYQAKGNYDAAIADFDKAIRFTSEFGHHPRKDLTPGPGTRWLKAWEERRELSRSDADLPLAYAQRGFAYFKKGNLNQATADLKKALDLGLDPSDQLWVETLLEELRRAEVK